MENQVQLKRFAALTRRANTTEAYVTRVILAESLKAAVIWFGEQNFEVLGNVYRTGK